MTIRFLDESDSAIYRQLRLSSLQESPFAFIEQLQLSTIIAKDSLIDFYKSFGFEKLGDIIKDDLIIDNQYVDAIYMVKHLKK